MRLGLAGWIVIGACVATAISELILFLTFNPPREGVPLATLWVAMPYLATAGLALLLRRHHTALMVLLVSSVLAAGAGLSVLAKIGAANADAQQQVRDAVQPGEDPSSGGAGKRKAGAEIGADITWLFSVLLLVVVPPVQLAMVVIPTVIGYVVSAVSRRNEPPEGAAITPPHRPSGARGGS
jgi:hypothetical protein